MKSIFTSRTFILAVIQAVTGGLVIFFTELDMAGAVLIIKSLGDILLRLDTKEEVRV